MKVKIFKFEGTSVESMEQVINDWLASQENILIKSITQSESGPGGSFSITHITVIILYDVYSFPKVTLSWAEDDDEAVG